MKAYILSCEEKSLGGEIGKYSLTDNGKLIKELAYPCDRPMYSVMDSGMLWTLLRAPLDSDESGIFALSSELVPLTEMKGTNGKCACHLCVDGNDSYSVNYLSGNIVKINAEGQKTVTHSGNGINPVRQEMPHTHCAIFSPDRQYVLCCDLGVDTLFCYDRDLNFVSKAKIADGYGIRHAVFSGDGKYVYALSEMKPAIHLFTFNNGNLTFIKNTDIACREEKADGAAIRISRDGKTLYASLRVENALAVYDISTREPRLLQKTDCGGNSPRDFNLTENYLIVTNEKSDNVVVYKLCDRLIGEKTDEIKTPKPLCCVLE